MALVHISSREQFSSLLTSSTIVVTDCELPLLNTTTPQQRDYIERFLLTATGTVYADWCGPCKAIAPMYEQLATQLSRPNQITFAKVNVDQQQEIARVYGVTA
jgi:thiol-disulfide isomerase/thioredoxin